jgi:hypothetical protein
MEAVRVAGRHAATEHTGPEPQSHIGFWWLSEAHRSLVRAKATAEPSSLPAGSWEVLIALWCQQAGG